MLVCWYASCTPNELNKGDWNGEPNELHNTDRDSREFLPYKLKVSALFYQE